MVSASHNPPHDNGIKVFGPSGDKLDRQQQEVIEAGLRGRATATASASSGVCGAVRQRPELRRSWSGWQVRRPALEGDPRPLLAQLVTGAPRLMLSTAFETGIGRRWLHHLAALQQRGPTPAAPGLAPGWSPEGPLASPDPEQVWEAA